MAVGLLWAASIVAIIKWKDLQHSNQISQIQEEMEEILGRIQETTEKIIEHREHERTRTPVYFQPWSW